MHQSLVILMFNARNTTVVLKFTVMILIHLLKSWIYYFRIVAALAM